MPIQSVIRLIRFFRIRAPLSASAASVGEFAGAGAGATIPGQQFLIAESKGQEFTTIRLWNCCEAAGQNRFCDIREVPHPAGFESAARPGVHMRFDLQSCCSTSVLTA